MRCMTRGGRVVGLVAVGLVVAGTLVGSTAAQTHPLAPSSAPRLARVERSAGVIEGKLTRVDGRSETVDVSIGFLGLLGKTLEVNVRVEDPGAFTMPWNAIQRYRRTNSGALSEVVCAENNDDHFRHGLEPMPEADKPDF